MAMHRASVQIFSTTVPVDGWGGLTLLGLAAVIIWAFPAAGLAVLIGALGGAVIAASAIMLGRRSSDRISGRILR